MKAILFLLLLVSSLGVLAQSSGSALTVKSIQVGTSNRYTFTKSQTIGGDTLAATGLASIKATTQLINLRVAQLFNFMSTAYDTIVINNLGTLGAAIGILGTSDQIRLRRIVVNGAAPTVSDTTIQLSVPVKLENSAALDFPSIAAGSSADLTIALVGAAVNDPVNLGAPVSTSSDIITTARVTAADVVTVTRYNIGSGPVDLPSATFKVQIIK
jgi:hypothetical protein